MSKKSGRITSGCCSSSSSSSSMRRCIYSLVILYSLWLSWPTQGPPELDGNVRVSNLHNSWVVQAAERSSSYSSSYSSAPSRMGSFDTVASLQSDKFHMNIRFLPRDMFAGVSSCLHSKLQVEITNTHSKAVIIIRSMMMLASVNTNHTPGSNTDHSFVFQEKDEWRIVPYQFHLALSKGKASNTSPALPTNTISSWFNALTTHSLAASTLTTSTSASPVVNSAPTTQDLPLFLEPNQSATILISFFPRLIHHAPLFDSTNPTLLDRTLADDYIKMIRGELSGYQTFSSLIPSPSSGNIPYHKNTYGPDYILKNPMVQLDTSNGMLRIPLGAQVKASRYNPIFLPHSLVFFDYGFVATADSFFDNHYFTISQGNIAATGGVVTNDTLYHTCWREIRAAQLQNTGALYEYDLYLNNPFNDTTIQITDLWTTLDVDAHGFNYSIDITHSFPTHGMEKRAWDIKNSHYPSIQSVRFNNCGPSFAEIDFCNQPKNNVNPIISIPPSAVKAYLGTVRWNPNHGNSQDLILEELNTLATGERKKKKKSKKKKQDHVAVMGYLHLKTSIGDWTVILEHATRSHPLCSEYTQVQKTKDTVSTSTKLFNVTHPKKNVPVQAPVLPKTKTPTEKKYIYPATLMYHQPDRFVSQTILSLESSFNNSIHVSPNLIDFGLISKSNNASISMLASHERRFNITNHMDIPLRIVRFTVTVEQSPEMEASSYSMNGPSNTRYSVRETLQDWVYGTVQNDNLNRSMLRPIHKGVTLNTSLSIFMKMDDAIRNGVILQPGETLVEGISLYPQAPEKLMRVRGLGRNGPRSYQGTILFWLAPVHMDVREFKAMIFDRPISTRTYVMQVPFVATIMYGHVEYSMEELFFPVDRWVYGRIPDDYPLDRERFLLTPKEDLYTLQRSFRFINRFPAVIQLRNFYIRGYNSTKDTTVSSKVAYNSDAFCTRHFQIISKSENNSTMKTWNSARFGQRWKEITVRYISMDHVPENISFLSKQCALTLETDIAGEFDVPLLLFTGLLDIEVEDDHVAVACPLRFINADHTLSNEKSELSTFHSIQKRGRECVGEWYKNRTLVDDVVISQETSNSFFKGIFDGIKPTFGTSRVENPILFSLGGLKHDEVSTPHSFFLTNKNPFPVTISTMKSAIEGMGIRLGVKNMPNRNNHSSSSFYNDIVATTSPLLLTSVFMSGQPDMTPSSNDDVNRYTTFSDSTRWNESMSCSYLNCTSYNPIIMSLDGQVKKVPRTPHATSLKRFWSIPAGGRARFEVFVRSPPRDAIREKNIRTFLAKGIVMSTNTGQKIPLIVEYQALLDRVYMNRLHCPNKEEQVKEEALLIDFVLSPGTPSVGSDNAVSVLVHNANPDVLTLRSIESCNRWIHLSMNALIQETKSLPDRIAVLHSHNICSDSQPLNEANFYNCATKWLENRLEIQPVGCGESSDVSDEMLRLNVISRFKDIESYLQRRYSFQSISTKNNIDNVASVASALSIQISKDIIDMFQSARTLWTEISKLQMNIISGHAVATFYLKKGTVTDESRLISINIDTPKLKSVLSIPTIFNHSLTSVYPYESNIQFEMTRVSCASALFVPIKNPTGYPLRVRLLPMPQEYYFPSMAHDGADSHFILEDRVFVQSPTNDENVWWTDYSFILKDPSSGIFLSRHNNRINHQTSTISLHLPNLYAVSALASNQCGGHRCSFSDTVMKEWKNKTETSLHSPIGASAALGEFLRGHYYSNDGYEDTFTVFRQRDNVLSDFLPFALSVDSAKEIIVPPFGSAELGPVYFRPPSRHIFKGSLLLENSLTGLETVTVEGKGGWNKLIFVDMSMNMDSENIITRYGMQAFLFPASSSVNNAAVVQSLGITNIGDTALNITTIYLNLPSSSSFRSKPTAGVKHDRCQERSFRIVGCHDHLFETEWSNGNFMRRLLSKIIRWKLTAGSISHILAELVSKKYEHIGPNVLEGFTILPGENRVIHISHTPDCIFRSLFTMLTLEYHDIQDDLLQDTFKSSDKVSLLLGYEDDSRHPRHCIAALDVLQSVHFVPTRDKDGHHEIISLVRQYIRFRFFGRGLIDFLSKVIPFILFIMILIDIIHTSRKRHFIVSDQDRVVQNLPEEYLDIEIFYFEQSADTANDLIQIARESTKKNLLAKYKGQGVINPLCITSNGSLVQQRLLVTSGGVKGSESGSAVTPTNRRPMGGTGSTLSDALFFRAVRQTRVKKNVIESDVPPLLPSGLGWREAIRRGIISPCNLYSTKSPKVSQLCNERLMNENKISPGEDDNVENGTANDADLIVNSSTCFTIIDHTGGKQEDDQSKNESHLQLTKSNQSVRHHKVVVPTDIIDLRESYSQNVKYNRLEQKQRNSGIPNDADAICESSAIITNSIPPKSVVNSASTKARTLTKTILSNQSRHNISREQRRDNSKDRVDRSNARQVPHKSIYNESPTDTSSTPVEYHNTMALSNFEANKQHADSSFNDVQPNDSLLDSYQSEDFGHDQELNIRLPPGLSPPPGFTSKHQDTQSIDSSSDPRQTPFFVNSIDVDTPLQLSDALGMALSEMEWGGSKVDIFSSLRSIDVSREQNVVNLTSSGTISDRLPSVDNDHNDGVVGTHSFSSVGAGKSFGKVIQPNSVSEVTMRWSSEQYQRKDESSFNFGLDLNILNILDFLDEPVDGNASEAFAGQDEPENDNAITYDNGYDYDRFGLYGISDDPWSSSYLNGPIEDWEKK